jgi:hypothetical protein
MEKTKVINALNEFKQNSKTHFNTMYQTMKTNFDFIRNFFTKENINKIEWEDIQKLGEHFYCMNMPLAQKKAFGNPNGEIESYRKIFTEMINDDISVKEKFDKFKEWNKQKDASTYGTKVLGDSFLSELLAYISKECFIINNRTWTNLHYFFNNNEIKRNKIKDGNDYIKINEKIKEIEHLYNEIVGKQTEFPMNIELDQFFSWFSERISKEENLSDENIESNNIKSIIEEFIIQSLKNFETGLGNGKRGKGTKYKDTVITIGYGFGDVAYTTYIAFLNYNQTVNNGIYPVILYNKDSKILEVCYGISVEKNRNMNGIKVLYKN